MSSSNPPQYNASHCCRTNAPIHPLTPSPVPLSTFSSARITFAAPYNTRYDQAGLLLQFTSPNKEERWIKAGVEFYLAKPYLASVATLTYSDWQLCPNAHEGEVTIEFRREGDELGSSLWLYQLVLVGGEIKERVPLREVCWVFAEQDGWEVQVSAMAARPAKEDVDGKKSDLVAQFSGAEVKFL